MKKAFLLFALTSMFLMQSCVQEEVVFVPVEPKLTAEIDYTYYTGLRWVEVEGEIVNRGNVPLKGAQIRYRLFDRDGYLINTYFVDYDVLADPGYGTYFYSEFPERYTYEVIADIWDLW
jgi:hypothetical protein